MGKKPEAKKAKPAAKAAKAAPKGVEKLPTDRVLDSHVLAAKVNEVIDAAGVGA